MTFLSSDCEQETEVLLSRPRREVSQAASEDLRALKETVRLLQDKIARLEEQMEEHKDTE